MRLREVGAWHVALPRQFIYTLTLRSVLAGEVQVHFLRRPALTARPASRHGMHYVEIPPMRSGSVL